MFTLTAKKKFRYLIAAILIITLAMAVMAYRSGTAITGLYSTQKFSTQDAIDASSSRWEALAKYYTTQTVSSSDHTYDSIDNLRFHINLKYGPIGR